MRWLFEQGSIDWDDLARSYNAAPLGDKTPDELRIAFSNSMYKCFALEGGMLVAAGRALSDGTEYACICDVAVRPAFQGKGLGTDVIRRLKEMSAGHRKIIPYANPGRGSFYTRLGLLRMRTAMAIFKDEGRAPRKGLVERT